MLPNTQVSHVLVERACAGDEQALSELVEKIHGRIYTLAVRFLWHPQDAEDACQEIFIKVIHNLRTFKGESRFETWAHRVAVNTLLNIRKQAGAAFVEFSADLADGLADDTDFRSRPDYQRLLEEVRIACTSAMLQCLEGEMRISYILGEILEFDHMEAAIIMEIPEQTFRKRLSRARGKVNQFMLGNCGLANSENACRCNKRLTRAVQVKRLDPHNLIFSTSDASAVAFPAALERIRRLKDKRRAAALQRCSSTDEKNQRFYSWLRAELRNGELPPTRG